MKFFVKVIKMAFYLFQSCCIDFTTKKGRLEFVKELETCCFINNRI